MVIVDCCFSTNILIEFVFAATACKIQNNILPSKMFSMIKNFYTDSIGLYLNLYLYFMIIGTVRFFFFLIITTE